MTTTTNPTPMQNLNENNNSNSNSKRLLTIAGIIIVLLLGTNIFLFVNKFQQGNTIEKQGQEITSVQKLNEELEKQYNEANSQLEEMKGTNAELNALIDKQKEDLAQQKDKIAGLIKNGKDLKAARTELDKLRAQVADYVAQITDLKSKNEQLTNANTQLVSEKTALAENLSSEIKAKEDVITAKQAVEEKNTQLAKKVDIASCVKVSDIFAQGYTIKDSGKEVKKDYAKNVQRLKICFNLTQNEVVPGGDEQFYIRVINPTGETMTIESNGGGIFKSNTNNEQIPYTQVKAVSYNNDAMNVCTVWDPGVALKNGNYDVEIWNKGFLAGKGTFTLK